MLDNFARSVQILITLSGNIEEQLKNVSVLLDNLANKKIVINIESINNLTGSADNAAKSINKISDNAKSTEKHTTSSFDNIKKSIDNVNDGIGNLVNSLTGIAMGGAISGLAWKTSAESTLYVEQIERAINSNKKLKISFAELEEFSKQQAEAGEGTRRSNIKEYYSVLMAGSKYIKGSSTEKLAKADYITDFWFANQELMKGQGFGSAEDLVRSSVRTTGKLTGTRRDALATALGVDPEGKEMSSAKSRMKYMMEKGEGTDMSEALSKRPWEGFATSLKSLKDSIGDSLVWPMNKFVQLLTGAVKLLNSIPGASLLIGLAGGAIALVSTLTLLNGVLSPGIALLKQMVLLTNADTVAKTINILASKALIITDWLGVTSKAARTTATAAAAASSAALTGAIGMEIVALEVDAVATTAAATATTGLAAAEWAALSPLLLLAIPLIAIAGLLYLVETRTHAFSNALDKLSKTEMSKDLIQWLEDVGYWAGYAVDKLGNVIESDLFSKIENLNSAYTNVKSGNVAGLLGLSNNKSSENKNITSQLLGSVTSKPSTNLLTMTKIVTPLSLMQNHLEFIVNVLSWFKNFFSGGNPLTNIYNAIIRLPADIYKSVSEWVSKQIEKVTTKFSEITKFFGDINTELSTKFGEITSDISTKFNEIITTITTKFEGITTTITTKFNDIITSIKSMLPSIPSIKSMLPSGVGGGTSEPLSKQEVINTVKEMKFDDGSSKFDFSDETFNAAYTEATTGTPQEHPNLANPEKYDKLVAKIADVIRNPSLYQNTSGYNTSNSNLSPHETEINRHEGDIDYEASKQKGITAGYILPEGSKNTGPQIDLASIASENENKKDQGLVNKALNMIGFADGGFVQKTGFALVHEGEPIIPADVASSSRLQNILESIAYGGSSSNTYGDINVRINYTPPSSSTSSNMIVMDRISFEHMVSDIIAKRLRQLNGY